jgi:PAS domain S-box-containing protein
MQGGQGTPGLTGPEMPQSLVEELRALQIINETGVLIASRLELDGIVQTVVDAGVALTGAQFGAFFYNVVAEDGDAYQLYVLSGAPAEAFSRYPHPRATPVFAPTFYGEGVVRSDDITRDPRYGRMAPHHGMPPGHLPVRSYLAIPVISRTADVLGGLFFGHETTGRFEARHERLLGGLAAQAAVAIDNARLFADAQAELRKRERVEATLLETDRRLNAVLDNATVAIFLMNDRQECVYMNAAAEKLTGFTLAEVGGRPLHDVIHHTRPDGSHFPLEECAIDRAFPENNQQQGEEVFVHKDGRFYDVAFTASPIRDESAKTVGTIIEVRDITEEKRDRQARDLLMREVDHRARNALFVVQSMLELTKAENLPSYKEAVLGRIGALARAQDSLARRNWQGGRVRDVVEAGLAAVAEPGSFRLEGANALLPADHVQPLSMIINELATNARKYGALSRPEGTVSVSWRESKDHDELIWREQGGPPIEPPGHNGFGSRLVGQLAKQIGGQADFDWGPDGLIVRILAPRSAFSG